MLSRCTKECLTRCNCCNRITRFRLPNRRFSHEWTRQEIQWEVGRRSPPLIAFRLIVRGILLLQSVLDRNAYLGTLATKVLLFYSLTLTIYFSLKKERDLYAQFTTWIYIPAYLSASSFYLANLSAISKEMILMQIIIDPSSHRNKIL